VYSDLDRNIQLCSEKYKCRVSDLTNSNFNLYFIDDVCISNIEPETSDRSILVCELLLVKDDLIFL